MLKSFQQTSLAICLEEAEPDRHPARLRQHRLCPRCSSLLSLLQYLLGEMKADKYLHLWSLMWDICPNNGQHPGKGRHWQAVWGCSAWGRRCEGQSLEGQVWSPPPLQPQLLVLLQGWVKEGRGTRGISINAQSWAWVVTEEDEALWLKGCNHFFRVPQPGHPAPPVQMDEEQRRTGLPAQVNLCLTLGGVKRPPQKCLSLPTFAFYLHLEGLHKGVKLYKCLRIGMGRVLSNYGVFWLLFISPQTQVLAGTDFRVWLISLLPPYMEMPLLAIIIMPHSFIAFLADVSQTVKKESQCHSVIFTHSKTFAEREIIAFQMAVEITLFMCMEDTVRYTEKNINAKGRLIYYIGDN